MDELSISTSEIISGGTGMVSGASGRGETAQEISACVALSRLVFNHIIL